MKFGGDLNYLPLTATFTVNYGGVYDFGSLAASNALSTADYNALPAAVQQIVPSLSAVQAYGFGVPGDFVQGIGAPTDTLQKHSHRSVLAGLVASESNRDFELWCALRR